MTPALYRAKALLVLTALLSSSFSALSADTPAKISAERLARIESVLEQYVEEGRIGGVVVLVLKDGKPVYEKAVGWRDKEAGKAMTTDTIFRIASQTKALTSVSILALMEEGKLALSNPISLYIPEFAKTTVAELSEGTMRIVPAKRQITIRDLITHTAGISYGTQPHIASLYAAKGLGPAAGNGWYTADKDEPICMTMERLASVPFVAHPGEAWVYGYNTDILGCVVERVSGMPLDQFIRTRITGPLKMNDTHFYLPPPQKERLTVVYSSAADGKAVRAPEGAKGQGHYVEGPRKSFAGGAGLVSTARDYARFLEMIRNGGQLEGTRILSPRSVALMSTNQTGTLHSQNGQGFGLGFQTTDRFGSNGLESVGAFGWGGAYGSNYRIDPATGLSVVFMINQLPNTSDVRERFYNLVYQAVL